MKKIHTYKVLNYMDIICNDSNPELAIELGLISIKNNTQLSHAFARKCKAIYDKYSLPYIYLEKILSLCLEYKLPSYFIVDIAKELVLVKKKEHLSYKSEWDVLHKYQTRSAEIFISRQTGEKFIFDKKYQYRTPKSVKKIINNQYFIPKKHNPILDTASFLLSKSVKRDSINLLISHNSFYFYKDGEFIIVDMNNNVIENSLDSNFIYNSYLDSKNKNIISINRVFVMRNSTPPRNYCHWISDYLPLISLFSRTINRKFTIVFSEPLARFQKESLSLIKNVEFIRLTGGEKIYAKKIYFFSLSKTYKHPANIGDPLLLNELRKLTRNIIPLHNNLKNIYISRKKADRRQLNNEEKLLPLLREKGFTILYSEELSWIEQVKFFKSAKNIVSVHGAGLTNMIFSEKCNNLIEIFPSDYGTQAFQVMADSLDINYHYYKRKNKNFATGLGNQFSNADEPIDDLAEIIFSICL